MKLIFMKIHHVCTSPHCIQHNLHWSIKELNKQLAERNKSAKLMQKEKETMSCMHTSGSLRACQCLYSSISLYVCMYLCMCSEAPSALPGASFIFTQLHYPWQME